MATGLPVWYSLLVIDRVTYYRYIQSILYVYIIIIIGDGKLLALSFMVDCQEYGWLLLQ